MGVASFPCALYPVCVSTLAGFELQKTSRKIEFEKLQEYSSLRQGDEPQQGYRACRPAAAVAVCPLTGFVPATLFHPHTSCSSSPMLALFDTTTSLVFLDNNHVARRGMFTFSRESCCSLQQ